MSGDLIGIINNIDIVLFYAINVGMQNSIFNVLMPAITNFGAHITWIVICVLFFIFGGEKGKKVAILCIVALILGYFISEALKYVVARPRPFSVLDGVNVLINTNGYSFPSGHATASFTGCMIIGKEYGFFYPLMAFACLVGFSRVYIGVHYPFDVVLGALLGILCSLLVLRFENKILGILKYNYMKITKYK